MKNFFNRLGILGWLLVATTVAFAAGTSDLFFRIGPKLGSDVELRMGDNGLIKWSNADQLLQFSNDGGVIFNDIGSGSGAGGASGGINLLINSSFETAPGGVISNWTASGGSLSSGTYSNAREGNELFASFVAASSGQYFESAPVTISDDINFGCMADLFYRDGDNAFEYKVLKETAPSVFTEVSKGSVSDLTVFTKAPTITFDCEPADVFKLRIEATGAGTILADLAYLGSNKNISSRGPKAAFVGSIFWPTGTCTWTNSTGSAWSDFSPVAACDDNARTVKGSVVSDPTVGAADGQLPQIQFDSLKKGTYRIEAKGAFYATGGQSLCGYRFSDGINATSSNTIGDRSGAGDSFQVGSVIGEITYDVDQGPTTIQLQSYPLAGGQNCVIGLSSNSEELEISVYYYPSSSETQEAFDPEQAEFFVEGNLSISVGNTIQAQVASTPTPWTASTLSLETVKGSAKVPCNGGNAPTGTTCASGDEQVGFVINFPRSGSYEVCINSILLSGGNHVLTQRMYLMDDLTSQVFSESVRGNSIHSVGGTNVYSSSTICDDFYIPSVGDRRFLVLFESTNIDTYIIMGRDANTSEPDLKFTVKPSKNDVSTPRLLRQVSTRARLGAEKGACHITNTGVVTFDSNDPDCWFIQSVSLPVGGQVEINAVTAGLKCVATSLAGNVFLGFTETSNNQINDASLPAAFRVQSRNDSAVLVNFPFSIACSLNK